MALAVTMGKEQAHRAVEARLPARAGHATDTGRRAGRRSRDHATPQPFGPGALLTPESYLGAAGEFVAGAHAPSGPRVETCLKSRSRVAASRTSSTARPRLPSSLLSNSLGTTLDSWSKQVGRWRARSGSSATTTLARALGGRVVAGALLARPARGVTPWPCWMPWRRSRASPAGLSTGGPTAMWLATPRRRTHRPARAREHGAADPGARTAGISGFADVRAQGLAAVSEAALPRWFTADFRQREPGSWR